MFEVRIVSCLISGMCFQNGPQQAAGVLVCTGAHVDEGSEITVAMQAHAPKIQTHHPHTLCSESDLKYPRSHLGHSLHRTQRTPAPRIRPTQVQPHKNRQAACASLATTPRATLLLTTSSFSQAPGLPPPREETEHAPLHAGRHIGTDPNSRLKGRWHTCTVGNARGCALLLESAAGQCQDP